MTLTTNRNNFNVPTGQELVQIMTVCTELSKAQFYQKLGVGGLMAIWLTAREMGLPVMMCLNGGLYTFDGKVTLSAQLMNMLIVNAGHRAEVVKLDATCCEINFVRSDRPPESATLNYKFTIEDAQKAGYLNKDVWKKHPRDMLFARCLSGGARKHMPDVLMNAYVQGEFGSEEGEIIPITPEVAHQDINSDLKLKIEEYNKNNPEKIEYINEIINSSNKSESVIYSNIFSRLDNFNNSYDEWRLKNPKKVEEVEKPTSMDEVAQ